MVEQIAGLYLQGVCNVKQHFQREGTNNIRRFDGAEVRAAHVSFVRQLFLGHSFHFSQGTDGKAQLYKSIPIFKFHLFHVLTFFSDIFFYPYDTKKERQFLSAMLCICLIFEASFFLSDEKIHHRRNLEKGGGDRLQDVLTKGKNLSIIKTEGRNRQRLVP